MFPLNPRRLIAVPLLATLAVAVPGCTPTQTIEIQVIDRVETASPSAPASLEDAFARLENREDWTDFADLQLPVHPAEKYMQGWAIAIDPGHGGHADQEGYKRGPAGVREAEVNWRVSKLLEKMLVDAGAQVVLTRSGDDPIPLEDRAAIANTMIRDRDGGIGADFFLSVHHNLSPKPTTNWTSIWFHDDPNNSEVGLDVARYLGHRVGEALRTQIGITGILMTDRQMYAGGFGVLRFSEVPAALAELSFYSHPEEEQRLRDGLYNLRCAYAMYVALCEYNYGGRPTQSLPTLSEADTDKTLTLSTTLDDGLPGWWGSDRTRIIRDGIAVRLDDQDLPITFDPETRSLSVEVPPSMLADEGEHVLKIRHNNFYKHANWPQRYALKLVDGEWSTSPLPAQRLQTDTKPGGS